MKYTEQFRTVALRVLAFIVSPVLIWSILLAAPMTARYLALLGDCSVLIATVQFY